MSRGKELREKMGMNRREFSDYYGIPYRTVQDWEAEKRELPDYLLRLLKTLPTFFHLTEYWGTVFLAFLLSLVVIHSSFQMFLLYNHFLFFSFCTLSFLLHSF